MTWAVERRQCHTIRTHPSPDGQHAVVDDDRALQLLRACADASAAHPDMAPVLQQLDRLLDASIIRTARKWDLIALSDATFDARDPVRARLHAALDITHQSHAIEELCASTNPVARDVGDVMRDIAQFVRSIILPAIRCTAAPEIQELFRALDALPQTKSGPTASPAPLPPLPSTPPRSTCSAPAPSPIPSPSPSSRSPSPVHLPWYYNRTWTCPAETTALAALIHKINENPDDERVRAHWEDRNERTIRVQRAAAHLLEEDRARMHAKCENARREKTSTTVPEYADPVRIPVFTMPVDLDVLFTHPPSHSAQHNEQSASWWMTLCTDNLLAIVALLRDGIQEHEVHNALNAQGIGLGTRGERRRIVAELCSDPRRWRERLQNAIEDCRDAMNGDSCVIRSPAFLQTQENTLLTTHLQPMLQEHFRGDGKVREQRTLLDPDAGTARLARRIAEGACGKVVAIVRDERRVLRAARENGLHVLEGDARAIARGENLRIGRIPADVVLLNKVLPSLTREGDEEVLHWSVDCLAPHGMLFVVHFDTVPRRGTRAHLRRSFGLRDPNPAAPTYYADFFTRMGMRVQTSRANLRFTTKTTGGIRALGDVLRHEFSARAAIDRRAIDAYLREFTIDANRLHHTYDRPLCILAVTRA